MPMERWMAHPTPVRSPRHPQSSRHLLAVLGGRRSVIVALCNRPLTEEEIGLRQAAIRVCGRCEMPRIAWLTDLHFDFLSPDEERLFLDRVRRDGPDVVVISGDISEARDVANDLRAIAERLALPVYFVLGNHDFYYGSI